jgi:hypothetical protein
MCSIPDAPPPKPTPVVGAPQGATQIALGNNAARLRDERGSLSVGGSSASGPGSRQTASQGRPPGAMNLSQFLGAHYFKYGSFPTRPIPVFQDPTRDAGTFINGNQLGLNLSPR